MGWFGGCAKVLVRAALSSGLAAVLGACAAPEPSPASGRSVIAQQAGVQAVSTVVVVAPFASSLAESFGEPPRRGSASQAECESLTEIIESPVKVEFSAHGYRAQTLRVALSDARSKGPHCVTVAWPGGNANSDEQLCRVAAHIDAAWFRLLENTLRRVPPHHARTVRRFIIDDRPSAHGIAAYDRADPKDGRDGHTIWLSEHLFVAPSHFERGNFGSYVAYHTDVEEAVVDGQPEDHELFSPVLLHEIGHLVMYHRANPASDRTSTPECARTCAERHACAGLPLARRERSCISPYCQPFKFESSTENWAEQYRFFYQGSQTRRMLALAGEAEPNCFFTLSRDDRGPAPWERGMPDMTSFQRSRWDSCYGRSCKPF